MKPPITLLILAAGMGSRYGGLKQIDGLGPSKEFLMEYGIFDAIKSGFNKVILVVREDFLAPIKRHFTNKLPQEIAVDFVVQHEDLQWLGVHQQPLRSKPYGTAHAILSAGEMIDEPFCMINADDFYGKKAYGLMYDFLCNEVKEDLYGMVAYRLKNTLSSFGTVSRGICEVDPKGVLVNIEEKLKVFQDQKTENIYNQSNGNGHEAISKDALASMNFFGFHPSIFSFLKEDFISFFEKEKDNPKSEYLIPKVLNKMIHQKLITLQAKKCDEKWFGVTYPEDKESTKERMEMLVENNVYPAYLWKQ